MSWDHASSADSTPAFAARIAAKQSVAVRKDKTMAGEQIIDVGHISISFNRCSVDAVFPCTFCKQPTTRALAHKLGTDPKWSFLPMCDPCMGGLQKMPVQENNMPEGSIIVPG
jgi:hypothetical protein